MKQIWITLSLADLRAKGACGPSYAAYHAWKRALGRGKRPLRILWSPLAMVWGLSHPDATLRGYVRWLIDVGLLPMWSLREADLRGANLTGAVLGGSDLYRANLTGANLSGADLAGADLLGANLLGANLLGANLRGADLLGAYHPHGDVPKGWKRKDGYLARG